MIDNNLTIYNTRATRHGLGGGGGGGGGVGLGAKSVVRNSLYNWSYSLWMHAHIVYEDMMVYGSPVKFKATKEKPSFDHGLMLNCISPRAQIFCLNFIKFPHHHILINSISLTSSLECAIVLFGLWKTTQGTEIVILYNIR